MIHIGIAGHERQSNGTTSLRIDNAVTAQLGLAVYAGKTCPIERARCNLRIQEDTRLCSEIL
ncbi:hypothetical protein SPHINGO8AM_80034 [Sphingomonas sp. 8AM]|nr:hypothetical protein SPHINGO8AM_80034 [Sphingomonas sp. 8AM]